MAVTSDAILTDGMVNVAKLLAELASKHFYKGIGVGNGSGAAGAANHDLGGGETHYETPDTTEYEASNKCKWESTFAYGDLTSHIFSEIVICESDVSHLNKCLLRAVFDAITLGVNDTVKITVTCEVKQGS